MQIRYVVSTMVFWGREHPLSFEQECQLLKSLGFGIELLPNIKNQYECRYERRNWDRLYEATRDMLVSMRSRSDKPSFDQWTEQIECARMLGANIITDLSALRIPENERVNGCDFAAGVVRVAQDNNVKICIETGRLPVIRQLGERFDSIGYCLDIGYANLDTEFSFREYVDQLVDRVVHLHLTDNYGRIDDHVVPGIKGGINRLDWDYLLNALDKTGNEVIGSLEMCPCVPTVMIRQATEFLFDELKWPNRPQSQIVDTIVGKKSRVTEDQPIHH